MSFIASLKRPGLSGWVPIRPEKRKELAPATPLRVKIAMGLSTTQRRPGRRRRSRRPFARVTG